MTMSEIDEAARSKAEKKARKEAKRAKKAAANGDASTLEPVASIEPEVAADEALQAKKDKKEKKKRKREAESAANGSSNAEEASLSVANYAEPAADGEEKTKKKRKKNVKGAFGNELKKAATGSTTNGHHAESSEITNGSSTIPSISPKEVADFQASSGLTYDPPSAPSEFAPILSFDQLPVASGIKDGLKSFSKPTTVQSASWGVQLRATKTARARDCVSIAATG